MPRKKKNIDSEDLFEQEEQEIIPDSPDDANETNVGSIDGQETSGEAETESESAPHMTADEFELFREDMREVFGDDTLKLGAELAQHLGFEDGGRWKQCLRYAMRRDADGSESLITIYAAPCGLYTAQAALTSDRVDDDMQRESLRYPDTDMTLPAAEAGICEISVSDAPEQAARSIYVPLCNLIGKHIAFSSDTLDWLADIFTGTVVPEEVPDEPEAAQETEERSAATYKPGEQTELAPEVFPSFRVWETPGKKKIIEQLNSVNAALKSNEEDLKELKESQKNAYKYEMDQKKCSIEMFGKLADYYSILKALEDARYESSVGDAVFAAYTTPEVKGKWVHVGTGQDISDARLRYGSSYVFVIAEFERGKPVGEDTEAETETAEKILSKVWQCPVSCEDGTLTEAITAADKDAAKTALQCGEHDYCNDCGGPECIGDAEIDAEAESGNFQNGNNHSETGGAENVGHPDARAPEIAAQRPQEEGKLEKEEQEYAEGEDAPLTDEIEAFDENEPEDDEPEGAA